MSVHLSVRGTFYCRQLKRLLKLNMGILIGQTSLNFFSFHRQQRTNMFHKKQIRSDYDWNEPLLYLLYPP